MAKSSKPSSGAADYPVGYGKPPKVSQFRKGQSGNPSGSSKKERARKADGNGSILDQIMLKEAKRKIPITENGVPSEITTYEAAARKLAISAAKGERSAQKEYFGRVQSAQERELKERMARFGLLAQYVQEHSVARAGAAIVDAMPIWPKPDDVVLDYVNCSGDVLGPIDPQQAEPFLALVKEYGVWQARNVQLQNMANLAQGGVKPLYVTTIGTIADLLSAIRLKLPPSFKAQLDWDESEIPAKALDIEGLDGGIVNLAHLDPEGDEIAYGLYQLVNAAMTASDEVRERTRLNIAANTTSLINRLRIERQNRDEGAPPPVSIPTFDHFYGEFASEDHGGVDRAAP